MNENQTRRSFLKTSAATALGAAAFAGLPAISRGAAAETWPAQTARSLISKNDVILFQGDSITDAGRSRDSAAQPNQQAALSHGYAWLAAAEVLVGHPQDDLKIFNRGIGGNKVFQLAERWQADCLDLK